MSQNCKECGGTIKARPNAKYCEPCKAIVRHRVDVITNEKKRLNQKSARLVAVEQKVRINKEALLTDAEQMKINRAIDSKYSEACITRIYKRGTAEFEKIAQQITPIHRIRRGIGI